MRNTKLKIGRIPYANLFPIFYYFDRICDSSAYSFISGVPSRLNRMLRKGELDISPSSSIEYLNNKNKYQLLPCMTVSSSGPIKSILLFSRHPIDKLNGHSIALTSESETSIVLLKIILKEFFSIKCSFLPTNQRSVKRILSSHSAVLHIGDNAMSEAKKTASPYIYDLGEIWDKHTGLPFVYALWVARENSIKEKGEIINQLSADLTEAARFSRDNLSTIAIEAPHKKWLSEEELINYWELISYDFTDSHLDGLKLFEKLSKKVK